MTTIAMDRLKKLQHKLYERAFTEAHAIVGKTSKLIIKYSTAFERSLPKKFSKATLNQLMAAFKEHRFILYGDFHALRQSQRGFLRLVRVHCDRQNTKRVVIALELIKAKDQKILDQYLLGLLSDQKFLEAISYHNDWGFPWDNFKMLLEFARSRCLPVIGINSANGGRDSLMLRDKFAAKCLVGAASKYPNHKIICLIGEYHLADSHLPMLLEVYKKKSFVKGKTLRILNNVDDYYFRLPTKVQQSSTEYLKMRKNYYCIMNTPPWMKWLSFSMLEELQASDPKFSGRFVDNDLDLENAFDDNFDIDYIFLNFLKAILEFIHIVADNSDLENFHINYSPEGNFINHLLSNPSNDPDDIEKIMHRCTTDGAFFVSQTNSVLITYLSINNLAETAGQYLFFMLSKFSEDDPDPSGAFSRRILKSTIGMLSSKILNPKRKFLEMKDYRKIATYNKSKGKTVAARNQIELASAILNFDRWIRSFNHKISLKNNISIPLDLLVTEQASNYGLSRCIGQIIALKLYKNIISMSMSHAKLKRLFTRKMKTNTLVYREIVNLYLSS